MSSPVHHSFPLPPLLSDKLTSQASSDRTRVDTIGRSNMTSIFNALPGLMPSLLDDMNHGSINHSTRSAYETTTRITSRLAFENESSINDSTRSALATSTSKINHSNKPSRMSRHSTRSAKMNSSLTSDPVIWGDEDNSDNDGFGNIALDERESPISFVSKYAGFLPQVVKNRMSGTFQRKQRRGSTQCVSSGGIVRRSQELLVDWNDLVDTRANDVKSRKTCTRS